MTQEPEADQTWPNIADVQKNIQEYPGLLLAALVDSCEDAILSKNLEGIVTSWNPAAERMFGYSAEEMIGQSILRIIPPELHGEEPEILRRIKSGMRIHHYQTVRVAKDGTRVEVSLTISPIRDYLGEIVGSSKILRDISQRKRDEEASQRLAAIVESSEQAIIGKDLHGTITSWNPAAVALFGYTAEEMIGQSIMRIIPEELRTQEEEILRKLWRGLKIEQFRTTRIKKTGERVEIALSISPIKNSAGQVIGSSKIARDVSIDKTREEELVRVSQHDQLTGLPNRQLLYDRLQMMLAQTLRNKTEAAVMVLDLDQFKDVNDHYGHHIGDELLVQTAARLKSAVRAVDTVCRTGGDEFVILASGLHGPSDASIIADKLIDTFSTPFILSDEVTVTIGISIGICMSSEGPKDGEGLLRMADIAMYRAKASQGSQVAFFSEEIARQEFRRRDIVTSLRKALQLKGFHLEYQPILDLRSGTIVGLESLIRMESGHANLTSPAEFIPIAEEAGLIVPIGRWVIQEACSAVRAINQEFGRSFFMSVNLSPIQLKQANLLQEIARNLEENSLEPGSLEIELTEGVLMENSHGVLEQLSGLRRMGVGITIDDFGTGFSNISYLWHFPVDRLKLDRSIIGSLFSHTGSVIVAKAIITLAHQLEISVVAEGVETAVQADVLRQADCDFAQGYLFSRPLPASALMDVLRPDH